MGAPRSRTPNEPGAWDIAGALYPDLDSVEWIPSDDADVFRLSFTSDREPRILKMATHGIRAVWREIGAFPAMRGLGIPEVLQFEHTSDDPPGLGIDFHVTRELAHPQQASRAMAELWINDRAGALEVAHWLGDCTRRIESLDWHQVPRANSPERSVEIGAQWRRPQYGQLLARSDCPAWARTFIDQVNGTLSRPEAFDSFGGWGGELLRAPGGRFVLIDWPTLGAAPRGSQAALALEILLRFRAVDPAPLVERFLAGWVPAGLDQSRLEELRLWWTHGILWWAGLDLSLGADPAVDLTNVYAAARQSLENDDPVSWLSRDAVVDSMDTVDVLFTRLEAGSSGHPIMADLVASDGRSLVVGLGGDKAVLSLAGPDGAPPYYASIGDEDAEGDISFDYGGTATIIQMRHAVPIRAARTAAAQFLREPGLPDSVRWEEV